jgi:hypothetical protein
LPLFWLLVLVASCGGPYFTRCGGEFTSQQEWSSDEERLSGCHGVAVKSGDGCHERRYPKAYSSTHGINDDRLLIATIFDFFLKFSLGFHDYYVHWHSSLR